MPTISGTRFAASLPEADVAAREDVILDAVRRG